MFSFRSLFIFQCSQQIIHCTFLFHPAQFCTDFFTNKVRDNVAHHACNGLRYWLAGRSRYCSPMDKTSGVDSVCDGEPTRQSSARFVGRLLCKRLPADVLHHCLPHSGHSEKHALSKVSLLPQIHICNSFSLSMTAAQRFALPARGGWYSSKKYRRPPHVRCTLCWLCH